MNYCIDTDLNHISVRDTVVVLESAGEVKRGDLLTVTKCDSKNNIIHAGFKTIPAWLVIRIN